MQRPTIRLIIALTPFAVVLFGCNPVPNTTSAHVATIKLTEIVDKSSRKPIDNNTITLRWETPDGNPIKLEQYSGKSNLSTTLTADGSVRLFVIVDAPGYITWSSAYRMNLEADKPLYITVEMERENRIQG